MSETGSQFEGDAGVDPDRPGIAIRRHQDRCFHAVEEIVPGGYIVQGIFIDQDDVAAVRKDGDDASGDACVRVR